MPRRCSEPEWSRAKTILELVSVHTPKSSVSCGPGWVQRALAQEKANGSSMCWIDLHQDGPTVILDL